MKTKEIASKQEFYDEAEIISTGEEILVRQVYAKGYDYVTPDGNKYSGLDIKLIRQSSTRVI